MVVESKLWTSEVQDVDRKPPISRSLPVVSHVAGFNSNATKRLSKISYHAPFSRYDECHLS
jgi:hypothetical protein